MTNGLREIADYAHSKGLKFGLWFEPEMISVDSELYRTHPDFLMQEPGRMPSASRSQHVLDFTRLDVRQTIEKQMRKILDTIPLDYIKWDMNRSLSDVYSITLDPQRQVAHRYMLGLYELLEHLTTDYPEILWEGCSGGGGRFDAGFIYYMPQSWTSDNTDAVERMKIQYGTSLAYPISSITAHVSAVPNHQTDRSTSLKTRGETAMSAVFGYELDLTKLSPEEKASKRPNYILSNDSYLIFGHAQIISATMRASGTVLWPTVIGVVSIWLVEVPVAYYLSYHTSLGIEGIWIGYPAAFIVSLILQYAYYKLSWQKKRITRLVS